MKTQEIINKVNKLIIELVNNQFSNDLIQGLDENINLYAKDLSNARLQAILDLLKAHEKTDINTPPAIAQLIKEIPDEIKAHIELTNKNEQGQVIDKDKTDELLGKLDKFIEKKRPVELSKNKIAVNALIETLEKLKLALNSKELTKEINHYGNIFGDIIEEIRKPGKFPEAQSIRINKIFGVLKDIDQIKSNVHVSILMNKTNEQLSEIQAHKPASSVVGDKDKKETEKTINPQVKATSDSLFVKHKPVEHEAAVSKKVTQVQASIEEIKTDKKASVDQSVIDMRDKLIAIFEDYKQHLLKAYQAEKNINNKSSIKNKASSVNLIKNTLGSVDTFDKLKTVVNRDIAGNQNLLSERRNGIGKKILAIVNAILKRAHEKPLTIGVAGASASKQAINLFKRYEKERTKSEKQPSTISHKK